MNFIFGLLLGVALTLPVVTVLVERLRRLRWLKSASPRLVLVDGNGPIIGRPGRAQWRLRRRVLLEAAQICDAWAAEATGLEQYAAEVCGRKIRVRVKEYDELAPEFSGRLAHAREVA